MTKEEYSLLKQVLSVQTETTYETNMVRFLCEYFTKKGLDFYLDHKNNVYVQKGNTEFFPCVLAHTDTVHRITKPLNVVEVMDKRPKSYFGQQFDDKETRLMLTGVDDKGDPSGIGGDDKAGIFVCLMLLDKIENIKAAFFVSEENGMNGSRHADPAFFANVGYAIQFDAPCNALVTEICSGVRLFDRDSEFFTIVDKTLSSHGTPHYDSHPYTDIMQIKQKFDFACLNHSCGYYHMHQPKEVVDVEDVINVVILATDLVTKLGENKYVYDLNAERKKRMDEVTSKIGTGAILPTDDRHVNDLDLMRELFGGDDEDDIDEDDFNEFDDDEEDMIGPDRHN